MVNNMYTLAIIMNSGENEKKLVSPLRDGGRWFRKIVRFLVASKGGMVINNLPKTTTTTGMKERSHYYRTPLYIIMITFVVGSRFSNLQRLMTAAILSSSRAAAGSSSIATTITISSQFFKLVKQVEFGGCSRAGESSRIHRD